MHSLSNLLGKCLKSIKGLAIMARPFFPLIVISLLVFAFMVAAAVLDAKHPSAKTPTAVQSDSTGDVVWSEQTKIIRIDRVGKDGPYFVVTRESNSSDGSGDYSGVEISDVTGLAPGQKIRIGNSKKDGRAVVQQLDIKK